MKVTADAPIGTRFIMEVAPAPKTGKCKCYECCFFNIDGCDLIDYNFFRCCSLGRQDGKDVILKLVRVQEK